MTSAVAQMVIEMIERGDLDQDRQAIASALDARLIALSPPSNYTNVGTSTIPAWKIAPMFKRGDRVEIVRLRDFRGVQVTVEQKSSGHNRWIVRPDSWPTPRSRDYEMARYPDCISLPDAYMRKLP